MSHPAVELTRTLIRNACVNDGTPASGQERRSVASLTDFFGVEGRVYEPIPGRQSLVYRVRGSDADAASLVLAPHLDVVPAGPTGWSVDPFEAEIVGNLLYGRGALDMLNITSAMAHAARPYLRGEKTPSGDLVFCALADEESGGGYGARPLVESHWDLVGGDYLLTEVAYPGVTSGERRRVPVSVGEKGAYWSHLIASGSPAHGSAPYATDNAIAKLVSALDGIMSTASPADIGPTWPEFAEALGLDPRLTKRIADIETVDDAIDEIAATDPDLARYVHASTHLTISPNVIEAGSKANIIAENGRAQLDIRSLPGMDRRFVDSHLTKAMGSASDDVEIVPVLDAEANSSPVGNRLWSAIASAVEDLEGHRDLVPMMTTVATDARFWRKKGTVAYGVGLFDDTLSFSQMLSLFHGRDERVSVDSVIRTTELYERVLSKFLDQ
jgi:acetylornithine deacetylase/succinyl-diaminopimelate desuccinylase-like protein